MAIAEKGVRDGSRKPRESKSVAWRKNDTQGVISTIYEICWKSEMGSRCRVPVCGDKPGSLEQNMLWLREADFSEVAASLVVDGRTLITVVTR
jgi:hypothetical protein